jgi:hypothetical protein
MARRRTTIRSSQSIAGAALVGVGMFVLYENLAGAIAWLIHVRNDALGVVPAMILGVSQSMQAHATDPQRFLQSFLRHMLVSFWPLLLVIIGTALSRDTVADNSTNIPKKIVELSIWRPVVRR